MSHLELEGEPIDDASYHTQIVEGGVLPDRSINAMRDVVDTEGRTSATAMSL